VNWSVYIFVQISETWNGDTLNSKYVEHPEWNIEISLLIFHHVYYDVLIAYKCREGKFSQLRYEL